MLKKISLLIEASIGHINQMLAHKIPLELGRDCHLFGENGVLDSLGLVTLIVDLEERLEESFSRPFILANEKAMSQKRSPFLTVGGLEDYIESLISEKNNA